MFHARRITVSLVALIALLGGIPQQVAGASLVPFHATTTELAVLAPCDPSHVCVSITGTGQATQLGKISETALFTIDPASVPAPGCNTNTGTLTLTGANGDSITLSLQGINCQVTPTTGLAQELYVVTGGTGRFSGRPAAGLKRSRSTPRTRRFQRVLLGSSARCPLLARSSRRLSRVGLADRWTSFGPRRLSYPPSESPFKTGRTGPGGPTRPVPLNPRS
jgi:hypothetical protein